MPTTTKPEITRQLQNRAKEVLEFVGGVSEELANHNPEGKWNILQNVDHLNSSLRPLIGVMKKPKLSLRWMFGKPNRPGRTYEQLVKRYQERLDQSNPTRNPFLSDEKVLLNKAELEADFQTLNQQLVDVVDKWNEEQLDKYLLPHPLLGKVTVREMLFFTAHHTQHHLEIMQRIQLP